MSAQHSLTRSWQFVLPKEGAGEEECEDAVGACDEAGAYAVADGAAEAFDARSWAALLAAEWVKARPAPSGPEEFGAWLAGQGERLHATWGERALPWYAEEKRRAGSFAAFVGLSFGGGEGRRWRAVALGDSCLFQLRGPSLVASLPLESHEQFNAHPPLAPSSKRLLEAALGRAVYGRGEAAPGDLFLLMSDALSAWFLESRARGRAALDEFASLTAGAENGALAELLRREREAGRLRDDDAALARIELL